MEGCVGRARALDSGVATEGRFTAHVFVRATLRRPIVSGELKAGSRLMQADIAAELEVSTSPVREALRDLATEGLITPDRDRGGIMRSLQEGSTIYVARPSGSTRRYAGKRRPTIVR